MPLISSDRPKWPALWTPNFWLKSFESPNRFLTPLVRFGINGKQLFDWTWTSNCTAALPDECRRLDAKLSTSREQKPFWSLSSSYLELLRNFFKWRAWGTIQTTIQKILQTTVILARFHFKTINSNSIYSVCSSLYAIRSVHNRPPSGIDEQLSSFSPFCQNVLCTCTGDRSLTGGFLLQASSYKIASCHVVLGSISSWNFQRFLMESSASIRWHLIELSVSSA